MSAELFECTSHIVEGQHIRGYRHSISGSGEATLRLAVKKYVPKNASKRDDTEGVTIVCCHSAGTVKELYEPFFDELLNVLRAADSRWYIRSIWIADVSTHGESGVLNEGQLGPDFCWDDHARDMLHMINVFREDMQEPLVGIGHSMGAQNIIKLSLLHPRLFTAIVPIEAIINREHAMNFSAVHALTSRRDVWASREEAFEATRKSSMCQSWDERVLQRWRQYGFRDLPTLLYPEAPEKIAARAAESGATPVTLSTTKHHEVYAFARPAFPQRSQPLSSFSPGGPSHADLTKAEHDKMQAPFYRPEAILTFRQLENLRPPCLYLWGSTSPFVSAGPKSRADKMRITGTAPGGSGGRVAEVVLEGEGHFVPLEKPRKVAKETWTWMLPVLEEWKQQWDLENEKNIGLTARERVMIDDDWRYWAKTWYSRKRAAKL